MESKRITRSRSERFIAGVAGGLAHYFGIDPLVVRIAFLVLSLLNGLGAVIYLVLWLIVPNEGSPADGRTTVQDAFAEMQTLVDVLVDRIRAVFQR